MYNFKIIQTVQDLLTYHEIVHQAYVDFDDRELLEITEVQYVSNLMVAVTQPETGFVCVALNKNNKPMGLCAIQYRNEKTAHIYSGWHNQKDLNLVRYFMQWVEQYLSRKGFTAYTLTTKRSSGAAIRCFEKKYGFKKESLTFRKEI